MTPGNERPDTGEYLSEGAHLNRGASLSSLARDRIRAQLISGQLQAGEVYSARSLATALGVSVTPVREAMLELAAEGLFDVLPNRGFSPVELSERDLDEIFELRLMLEVPAMGSVAKIMSSDCASLCQGIADEITKFAASNDVVGFLEADRRFHLALLSETGNGRLVDIVGRLRDHTRLFGIAQLAERGELGESAAEHHEILRALVSGERRTVERLVRQHLRHTRGSWAGQPEGDG